ncbi:DUF4214 domain-containing protein [Massilia sp. erpn]|uniref:DUF4214 domain-containing protein n=1 Tax=Massilia sp. erpn TaxID=2738142 RepID=UPI00210577FF|nr:DUF4214 domain-containing protein [Massilia sp. erpn]UTY58474.1 DUF4214 domain-containing protein [Massilia sp. erpn]
MSRFTFAIGDHTYRLVEEALDWSAANANAKRLGGHLATITSAAENTAIYTAVSKHLVSNGHAGAPVSADGGDASYLWLGLNDIASENNWEWSDGTAFSYSNWGHGKWGSEPDNSGDQDAVGMGLEAWPAPDGGLGVAGQWNDVSQYGRLWSIVEYEPFAKVTGSANNDTLAPTAANNNIDGGAGLDTLGLQGLRAAYTINRSDAGFSLVSDDGIFNLSSVERVKFKDANIALDIEGNAGNIYRLYQAAYNRVPDKEGLGFWMSYMDKGMTIEEVGKFFMSSPEAVRLYGENPSHEELVNRLYDNVLHRAPEPDGKKFWLDALKNGTTAAQALNFFADGHENRGALAEIVAKGIEYIPYGG